MRNYPVVKSKPYERGVKFGIWNECNASFQIFSTVKMDWNRVHQADIGCAERRDDIIFCGKEKENH
jgi:hypothetical protein